MYKSNYATFISISRITYTILVIFSYICIYSIQYPGSYNVDFFSNEFDLISVLSCSVRPFILSNIIMGLLSMIFPYIEMINKDGNTKPTYDKLGIILMIAISITMSFIQFENIEPFIHHTAKSSFYVYYSLINCIGSLCVAWFNRQMIINGLGYGITMLLSIQIINKIIRRDNISSMYYFYQYMSKNILFFLIMISICLVFELLIVNIKIRALVSKSYHFDDKIVSGNIQYKPSNASIMANIMSQQSISLMQFLKEIYIYRGEIKAYDTYSRMLSYIRNKFQLVNAFSNPISYMVLVFIFSYVYNTVYYNNSIRTYEDMRKNVCYMEGVSMGIDTERKIDHVAIICSIISVVITLMAFTSPLIIRHFIPNITCSMDGLDFMIIISSFYNIIKFIEFTYTYHSYAFNIDKIILNKNA